MIYIFEHGVPVDGAERACQFIECLTPSNEFICIMISRSESVSFYINCRLFLGSGVDAYGSPGVMWGLFGSVFCPSRLMCSWARSVVCRVDVLLVCMLCLWPSNKAFEFGSPPRV